MSLVEILPASHLFRCNSLAQQILAVSMALSETRVGGGRDEGFVEECRQRPCLKLCYLSRYDHHGL